MAQYKRQHYLAQSYLKGFADRKHTDAIWQFRKSTNEIRLKGIHKVAQSSYLYSTEDVAGNRDHFVERWFARVESWWPCLLGKIHSNVQSTITGERAVRITPQDRANILQYMLMQSLRVPKYMEWMRRYIKDNHPRRHALTDREVRNIRVNGLAHNYDDMASTWVQLLDARKLTIEGVPAGSKVTLFTCDNPVVIYNPKGDDGIVYDTTRVLFLVSRSAFIMWAGPCTTRDYIEIKIHHDRDKIDDFLRDLIEISTDEVYSSNPGHLQRVLSKMGCQPRLQPAPARS